MARKSFWNVLMRRVRVRQTGRRRGRLARVLACVPLILSASACAGEAPSFYGRQRGRTSGDALEARPLDEVARELEALNEPFVGATGRRDTFRSILSNTIDKDAYLCMPSPRSLFFGEAPEGERVIRGVMPHYGFFFGPMSYLVRRVREPARRWEVSVHVAIEGTPPEASDLELADCALAGDLGASLRCEGTPYALSGTREACPGSGSFRVKATPLAVEALLRRWSTEAERYWNRDASALGIPVTYDFEFTLARAPIERARSPAREEAWGRDALPRVDMVVPLAPTCGRTPYFASMRAGWSLPILAHEVGHVMGLLDEYEMFSGITGAYPKTPFPGAEVSRMGLSMLEGTRVLPLHHYLILRRYVCPEPKRTDPYPPVL